jgi:hypothetical protein
MKKFTIFSVLLTIVVVVVVGQILVDEYLPDLKTDVSDSISISLPSSINNSNSGENVFGADLSFGDTTPSNNFENVGTTQPVNNQQIPQATPQNPVTTNPANSPLNDFEDFTSPQSTQVAGNFGNVVLREDQIKSAGFVGAYLEVEDHDGLLFKSVPTDDINDLTMDKIAIRTTDQFLARVYVFRAGINSNIRDVYQLLRSKSLQVPSVSVNETNDFAVNSFYFNDSRRTGVVFLVVRIGNMVYAFSYPQNYHSQIKNLIQLLEWEVR